jgi:RHS repeat-associated protein
MGCLKISHNYLTELKIVSEKKSVRSGKTLKKGRSYLEARYYNPRISNWLSVDPIALYDPVNETEHYLDGEHNGGYFNPKNMSVYGYTYQNPVLYVDPNGKQSNATNPLVYVFEGFRKYEQAIGSVIDKFSASVYRVQEKILNVFKLGPITKTTKKSIETKLTVGTNLEEYMKPNGSNKPSADILKKSIDTKVKVDVTTEVDLKGGKVKASVSHEGETSVSASKKITDNSEAGVRLKSNKETKSFGAYAEVKTSTNKTLGTTTKIGVSVDYNTKNSR